MNWSFFNKEKPDVWIEPSKSKIVQVKATEIINSDKYVLCLMCPQKNIFVENIRKQIT